MGPGAADTIFAPASGQGRAAVAIIRLSGPAAARAVEALSGPLPPARRLALRRLRDRDGDVLDQALVAWLPGPTSFTGEDMAELHLHGSSAVRGAVLAELGRQPGLRLAEPGEFTRRAFRHGRLDLSEVEGLADLIAAETEAQRRQAVRQLDGSLRRQVEAWRESLLTALALAEAALDFSDEGDVSPDLHPSIERGLAPVEAGLAAALADGQRGERLRDGFFVVLAGAPNAGKSTLLNALARREAAIVSDEPGTTRDPIEVRLDLAGLPVTLVDTAGLREADSALEREGVRRTWQRMQDADLVLALSAPDAPFEHMSDMTEMPTLRVRSKADLGPAAKVDLAVSAKTGEGLDQLLDVLREHAAESLGLGDALITRERHRRAFEEALTALRRRADAQAPELVAEEIRLALRALGRVAGRVDVEEVLDCLFASFCIGK